MEVTMNVYIIKSGEVPNREYALPITEKKAAQLLLNVMKRGGRQATISTVPSHIVNNSIAQGHIAPDGWDVIVQRAA